MKTAFLKTAFLKTFPFQICLILFICIYSTSYMPIDNAMDCYYYYYYSYYYYYYYYYYTRTIILIYTAHVFIYSCIGWRPSV